MRETMQKFAKTLQNVAYICKIVGEIVCKPEKFAKLEKICTDGITRVTLFWHLCIDQGREVPVPN